MMSDFRFPISLESMAFTRMAVLSVPVTQKGEAGAARGMPPPENSIDVEQDANDGNRYIAAMRTKINPDGDKKFLYVVDMECVASFRVAGDADGVTRTRGVSIVAHNILYGAIREAVAWATGRQANGQVMLNLSVLRMTEEGEESPRAIADSSPEA
jgi:hypothetical protein